MTWSICGVADLLPLHLLVVALKAHANVVVKSGQEQMLVTLNMFVAAYQEQTFKGNGHGKLGKALEERHKSGEKRYKETGAISHRIDTATTHFSVYLKALACHREHQCSL